MPTLCICVNCYELVFAFVRTINRYELVHELVIIQIVHC